LAEHCSGLTTLAAPSLRSAQPHLLCEEGNTLVKLLPLHWHHPRRSAV